MRQAPILDFRQARRRFITASLERRFGNRVGSKAFCMITEGSVTLP
jgi:hypothetical protein